MAKSFKKPVYDGIQFDSNPEVDFYKLLNIAKEDGRIKDFVTHPEAFTLLDDYVDFRGKKIKGMTYSPDFSITLDNDETIYVDIKGGGAFMAETDSKLKKKMFDLKYDHKLYFISRVPQYQGGEFCECSPYYDFVTKIRNKYKKLHPNLPKGMRAGRPTYTPTDWTEHFEFEDVAGLFYVWTKTLTSRKKG